MTASQRAQCTGCDFFGRTLAEYTCDYCYITGQSRTIVDGKQVKGQWPCPVRRVKGVITVYSGPRPDEPKAKVVDTKHRMMAACESYRDEIISLVSLGYTDRQIVERLKIGVTDRYLNDWRCSHKIYAKQRGGKHCRDMVEHLLLNRYGAKNAAIMMGVRVDTIEKWGRSIGIDISEHPPLPDSQLNLVQFDRLFRMWRADIKISIRELAQKTKTTYRQMQDIICGEIVPPLHAYKMALEWWNGTQKR